VEPRWLDDAAAREDLLATLGDRRVKVCFAVPGADARLLVQTVPPEEKKHLGKSLPFSLEERVAEDIDDLHFAYCPLQGDDYAVAITSREKMADWHSRLSELPGIQAWIPEPLMLPWRSGEWCVVVEGGEAIVRFGHCGGFTVERELVATLLQGVVAAAGEPEAIVVYGEDQASDTALLPADLRDRVQWRRGNLCAALMLSDSGEVNLNLLQGSYAPRLPLGRWWTQWRAVAAAFAIAFVLQMAATYADYRYLLQQNLALRGAVEASYRKAFPKGAVVDAEKQLRRQLEAAGGTGRGSNFVGLMERVGSAVADSPGTSISTINYSDKGDEMRLNIVAADFEGVEKLRSRINEAGLEAVMESSSTRGERVSARLRVKGRS
jgi:type II secretion system protein L